MKTKKINADGSFPMAWYKFLIYVSLPLSILRAIVQVIGLVNDVAGAWNGYYVFDVVAAGILLILEIGAFAGLIKKQKQGPFLLIGMWLFIILYNSVYVIIFAVLQIYDSLSEFIGQIVGYSIAIVLNYIYFKRRWVIFAGEPIRSEKYTAHSEPPQINETPIAPAHPVKLEKEVHHTIRLTPINPATKDDEKSGTKSEDTSETQVHAKAKKKKPIIIVACLLIAGVLIAGGMIFFTSQKTDFAEIAENVLYLEVYDADDNCIGSASGFLVKDGITLVTNYHVIEDAYHIVAMTADGNHQVDVSTILAYDKDADLAVLQCDGEIGVNPLTLANSDSAKQGDAIYVVGYPLGLANTLSDGIISARYQDNDTEILQITAAISGGSSGGALLNEKGQVIGVISAYYEDGQNLNIAVASNEIHGLIESTEHKTTLKDRYIEMYPQAGLERYFACVRTISVSSAATANKIYNEWVSIGATEDNLIALMDKYGKNQGGGQLYFVEPRMWVDEIDTWCFSAERRRGDITIIENPYGYSICYFSDAIKWGEYYNGGYGSGTLERAALVEQYTRGDLSQQDYEELMKLLYKADSQGEYFALESFYLKEYPRP